MKKLFSLLLVLACLTNCEDKTSFETIDANQACEDRTMALVHTSLAGFGLYSDKEGIQFFDDSELEFNVNRYWQSDAERIFEISLTSAFELVESANNEYFGIVFSNLESPNLLEGEWGRFSGDLIKASDLCDTFFLIDEELLKEITQKLNSSDLTLIARIGLDEDKNPVTYFLIQDSLTKGSGIITGARIPRP